MSRPHVIMPADELIDQLGGFAASLGINRIAGQLYVLLFLSDRPLSLDDMTGRLHVSKGHVSTNIRALERWQAVRKVVVRGSRKDYYEANRDTLTVIFEQLQHGLNQRLQQVTALLQSVRGQKGLPSESEKYLNQLESMVKTARQLSGNMNMIRPLLASGKRR